MSWFKGSTVIKCCHTPDWYYTPTLCCSDKYSSFEIIHFKDLPTGSFRLLKQLGNSESEFNSKSLLLKLQDKEGSIHIVWATSFLTECINKRSYTHFIAKLEEETMSSSYIPDWVYEDYRIYFYEEKRNINFQEYMELKGIKDSSEKGSICFLLC